MNRSHIFLPTLIVVSLMTIWEATSFFVAKPYVFPGPIDIFLKMIELYDSLLFVHLPATLTIVIMGLGISMALGVTVAILMHQFTWLERAIYPLLVVSQTIPIIALAPVFVLWFGYSIWSKVVVTVLITFFPITVNTFDGLRSTSRDLRELFMTMKASKWQMFCKLYVPSALPSFLSGMKIAIPLSVVGAAIGEWLGAQAGLGYFSRRMMTQFDGPGVFAPIVLLSLIGVFGFVLIKAIEKYILRWRKNDA